MKLDRVEIKNFRSIKDLEIQFDNSCKILIGKNEAGKSNILKAIAAVFNQYKVSDKDMRKEFSDENIEEYYVRAVFTLENDDFSKIIEITNQDLLDLIVFKNGRTILEYLKTYFSEVILRISIENNAIPQLSYWASKNTEFELENKIYFDNMKYNIETRGTLKEIKTIFFETIEKLFQKNPFQCHYFQNNIQQIPSTIIIDEFLSNPKDEKFSIIQDAFKLISNGTIRETFNASKSKDGDYINLLNRVSSQLTNTFRNIWKDFNDTKIEFIESGPQIKIKISNKSKFSYEDRSDGFRKFLTILLRLSLKNNIGQLSNKDIILLDEPDQSLYPSSARYLRDELLKIAENSNIVYSTHSQYMIDQNCIERHLIVEKKDDITVLNTQKQTAAYSSDELLLNAIGTSVFDCLKKTNLIFEGWWDKLIFEKYCKIENKVINLNKVGIVYLSGISGVETLVQLLILANKNFVIISDSDATSLSKKKSFFNDYSEFKSCWFDYGDGKGNISTLEDYYETSYLEDLLKKYDSNFIYKQEKNAIENIEVITGKNNELKRKVKKELVEQLDINDLKEEYALFVEKIAIKIKDLK